MKYIENPAFDVNMIIHDPDDFMNFYLEVIKIEK